MKVMLQKTSCKGLITIENKYRFTKSLCKTEEKLASTSEEPPKLVVATAYKSVDCGC